MTTNPIERRLWIAKNVRNGSIALSTLSTCGGGASAKFCHQPFDGFKRKTYRSWADAQSDGWETVQVDLSEPVNNPTK